MSIGYDFRHALLVGQNKPPPPPPQPRNTQVTALVANTCCSQVVRIRYEYNPLEFTRKNAQVVTVCKQVVTNLFTSCRHVVFALIVTSCRCQKSVRCFMFMNVNLLFFVNTIGSCPWFVSRLAKCQE
jgi:hypothetical protein